MPGSESTSSMAQTASRPRRAPDPVVQRWLILGLDGATFDVLGPLMQAGRMPNLLRLTQQGVAGTLVSTKPPMTPAAWTTFMTGKGPGKHGIIDFERYDPWTGQISFNSTFQIREKTIWEILSTKGLKVGSINLPMTYPPTPVNGFMISGFETPSVDVDFTYPPDLKKAILERFPDYSYKTNWRRKILGGERLYRHNLDYIKRTFWQGFDLAKFCTERFGGWDVMMVLLKFVDNLQHKAWRYIDPNLPADSSRRSQAAAECFTELDRVVGEFAAFAEKQGATLMVMSDHGHGSLDGKVQPNLLLRDWGYLKLRDVASRWSTRARYLADRMLFKKGGRFAANDLSIERELAVDWSGTSACVMHAGIYGFLYINLKGRQPTGIVPAGRYEALRDEIRENLLGVMAQTRGGQTVQVFPEVHKAEELYNCSREEHPWLPDLILVPVPGLAVVRKIRGRTAVRWLSPRRREGTHRLEGMLTVYGPHVQPNGRFDANIADITPTVLAGLGLPVPIDMEGRVLTDLFDRPVTVQYEPPLKRVMVEPTEEVYTAEQREALEKRLADLGYLE
jgi:predicted AlkP superfamily phosphohydrolase/phosphomutase